MLYRGWIFTTGGNGAYDDLSLCIILVTGLWSFIMLHVQLSYANEK